MAFYENDIVGCLHRKTDVVQCSRLDSVVVQTQCSYVVLFPPVFSLGWTHYLQAHNSHSLNYPNPAVIRQYSRPNIHIIVG